MKKFSFFSTWIVITIVYLIVQFLPGYPKPIWETRAFAILGLFVPYGFWNTLGSALTLTQPDRAFLVFIPLALLILLFFRADRFIDQIGVRSRLLRTVLYLIILFCLTFLVDWTVWGTWQSWNLVTGQQKSIF